MEQTNNEDLLIELSRKTLVKLRNNFTGFFAEPELTTWTLEVEHVTHRGWIMNFEGKKLKPMLCRAIYEIEHGERLIKDRQAALKILNPNLNEYDIAELERQER